MYYLIFYEILNYKPIYTLTYTRMFRSLYVFKVTSISNLNKIVYCRYNQEQNYISESVCVRVYVYEYEYVCFTGWLPCNIFNEFTRPALLDFILNVSLLAGIFIAPKL